MAAYSVVYCQRRDNKNVYAGQLTCVKLAYGCPFVFIIGALCIPRPPARFARHLSGRQKVREAERAKKARVRLSPSGSFPVITGGAATARFLICFAPKSPGQCIPQFLKFS